MANPHLAHVDTRLHRPTVMPDSCAEEGCWRITSVGEQTLVDGIPVWTATAEFVRREPPGYGWRENQGDYIHDVPKPKKVPRNRYRVLLAMLLWPVVFVALVALIAVFKQ